MILDIWESAACPQHFLKEAASGAPTTSNPTNQKGTDLRQCDALVPLRAALLCEGRRAQGDPRVTNKSGASLK